MSRKSKARLRTIEHPFGGQLRQNRWLGSRAPLLHRLGLGVKFTNQVGQVNIAEALGVFRDRYRALNGGAKRDYLRHCLIAILP